MNKVYTWVAATAAVGILLTGCTDEPKEPASTPSSTAPNIEVPGAVEPGVSETSGPSRGQPDADVDPENADAVAKAAATAMLTIDSRQDSSPGDAVRRARPYLTDDAYQRLEESPVEVATIDWDEFVASDAYNNLVSVKKNLDDPVEDSPTSAWRGYIIETEEVGPADWSGIGVTYNAYVHLVKDEADEKVWKVDTLEIRQERA